MDREEPPPDVSGAKQIPGGGPDRDWGLLDLEQYAQAQHQEIVAGEATLAPAYWRLGQALNLIRHQRGQGAWGKYLESLGIHRVRACKARSIARHFPREEDVTNVSVEAAYEQAKATRPKRLSRTLAEEESNSEKDDAKAETEEACDPRSESVEAIADFLQEIQARADRLIDVAGFAERNQRESLFPAYRAAMERLADLPGMCHPARAGP